MRVCRSIDINNQQEAACLYGIYEYVAIVNEGMEDLNNLYQQD